MINFDIEMNDIKIFSDEYMRKINLKGYILENKYPNNKFKEKHMIFFLETHGEKYQLFLKCIVDEENVESIDIELQKMDKYEIAHNIPPYVEQFFCVLNEKIEYKKMDNLSDDDLKKFHIKKDKYEDEDCIVSNNRILFLQPIKNIKFPYIDLITDTFVSSEDFVNNIFSKEEAIEYNKKMFDYQIKNLGKF